MRGMRGSSCGPRVTMEDASGSSPEPALSKVEWARMTKMEAMMPSGGGYAELLHVHIGQVLVDRIRFGLDGIQSLLKVLDFGLEGHILLLEASDFCLGFGVGAGGKGKSKDDGGKNLVHEKTSGQR